MKFRVLFLRKKYLYFIIFILIIIFAFMSIFMFCRKTTVEDSQETFSIRNDDKVLRTDLTGDGKEDILYIKTQNTKYYIQVTSNKNNFLLQPNKKLSSLGSYCSYWPLKITLLDINRDRIPEIFVQASENGTPFLHIFQWNGKTFEDILYNTHNVIGFIDSKNNRTPKFICGSLSGKGFDFSNYILINNKFQYFNFASKNKLLDTSSINSFITYISNICNTKSIDDDTDFMTKDITGDSIALLSLLHNEKRVYKLQNGFFTDNKFNKDGDGTEVNWTLCFKGISIKNKSDIKNFSLNLSLKYASNNKNEKPILKIYSIKFAQ